MSRSMYILLLILLSLASLFFSGVFSYMYISFELDSTPSNLERLSEEESKNEFYEQLVKSESAFIVVKNDIEIGSYDNFNDAKILASSLEDAKVYNKDIVVWWDKAFFQCYENDEKTYLFENYASAYNYVKNMEKADIYDIRTYVKIYNSSKNNSTTNYKISSVPYVSASPEFVKGSELASLAILLKSEGKVGIKTKLYEEIEKDTTPYGNEDNHITYGNPNIGLVGDITTSQGYGTFDKPLYNLLENYMPRKALNLTGVDFSEVESFVSSNSPVLVITNDTFQEIPLIDMLSWTTVDGSHITTVSNYIAVVVVGFDENYIYINNPINYQEYQQLPKEEFIKAWEQMGKQAITYTYK